MKRVAISSETLDINISVSIQSTMNIAASDVTPILDPNNNVDEQAKADYDSFVDTVFQIIEYYGFQCIKKRSSESYPFTSRYTWIAHDSEIENADVPMYIRLRISNHAQDINNTDEYERVKQREKKESQEIKLPATKRRQRYKIKNIIVNSESFSTYEEALNAVESMVHDWLKDKGVDTSVYEPLGKW